ncbi:MAG: hypothetical protein LBR72_00930 [Oscillospiraceae bacterium]|nr:hypothetical protein [Oscillospiraceae bacterium]
MLAVFCLAADILLTALDPAGTSPLFYKNDFEKVLLENGSRRFERVFYGNSAVTSAYVREKSGADYADMGLDYGVITDIVSILEKRLIVIEDELVLGLNYNNFIDSLDTNPTYPWHRTPWQPYLYFQRDRFLPVLTDGFSRLLKGEGFLGPRYTDLKRAVYHGVMDDEKLAEKVGKHRELFFWMDTSYCEKNLLALEKLCGLCAERGVRLRAVWMPWNPKVDIPPFVTAVQNAADAVFTENGVEVLDMVGALTPEHFHDIGHLEYTAGAPVFTEMIDRWLREERTE